MAKKTTTLIPDERIERAILLLRGQRVMLDADLAALYGVTTKQLIQAVKRNGERFPGDFAFVLTGKEFAVLRSQTVTSSSGWGGRQRVWHGLCGVDESALLLHCPRTREALDWRAVGAAREPSGANSC